MGRTIRPSSLDPILPIRHQPSYNQHNHPNRLPNPLSMDRRYPCAEERNMDHRIRHETRNPSLARARNRGSDLLPGNQYADCVWARCIRPRSHNTLDLPESIPNRTLTTFASATGASTRDRHRTYDGERLAGIQEAVRRLQKKSRSFYLASSVFSGRLRTDLILLYVLYPITSHILLNIT